MSKKTQNKSKPNVRSIIAFELVVMALATDTSVRLTSPPQLFAGPAAPHSPSKAKISRWWWKTPFSLLTAPGYSHQNSIHTKLGVYTSVEFTPFVKSSASSWKRMILNLKFQFQCSSDNLKAVLHHHELKDHPLHTYLLSTTGSAMENKLMFVKFMA